jgi:HEAT repeat protein
VPDAHAALLAAVRDSEPRVREAALRSLSSAVAPPVVDAARAVLSVEPWSFVKTQALDVLSRAPASGSVDDAVRGALGDSSWVVRRAALDSLAARRAVSARDAIRERLNDVNEAIDVRAAAARALGAICDAKSADRLTELARKLATPAASEDVLPLGLGALVGLAKLGPADLRSRIAPLLAPNAPSQVRAAAEQALSSGGVCR